MDVEFSFKTINKLSSRETIDVSKGSRAINENEFTLAAANKAMETLSAEG
jgi:hypothetical protein